MKKLYTSKILPKILEFWFQNMKFQMNLRCAHPKNCKISHILTPSGLVKVRHFGHFFGVWRDVAQKVTGRFSICFH